MVKIQERLLLISYEELISEPEKEQWQHFNISSFVIKKNT